MPGLLFAGRRWNLSSDDLPIPALIETALRLVWLIGLSASYFSVPLTFDSQCAPRGRLLLVYLAGLQLLQIATLAVNAAIIHWSMQGTVLWEEPRKGLTKLICVRVALFLPEIGWHLAGAVWSDTVRLYPAPPECIVLPTCHLVQHMVQFGLAMTVLILLGIYFVFDPAGSVKHFPQNENIDVEFGRLFTKPTEKGRRKLHRSWLRRIRLLFCCVSFDTGSRDAYRDVSELFSGWFTDIDVVPSDLLCALILLRKKQNRLRKATGHTAGGQKCALTPYLKRSFPITIQPALPPPVDWMTPQNALHFMRFAWGSYGWPAFMLTHLCTGLCIIWEGLRCFSCLRTPLGLRMRGDNCCECHTATVRTLAKVSKQDILMMSFKDSLYKIPFFVCYDHSTSSVLLVVRGTLSVNDILTDFTGDSTQMGVRGVPSDSRCHKGILKCANYIREQLLEHCILEEAFKTHPTYKLVLTGHSLGAGVAAALAVLLRDKFPDLMCYSFSPPGGTFSRDLCRYTESFVFSVVVGDDVVPRLGLAQLDELKKQLLICLMEADRPKHEIIMGGLNSFFFNSRSRRNTPRMSGSPTAKYEAMKKQKIERIIKKLDVISKENSERTSSSYCDTHRAAKNTNGACLTAVVNVGVGSLSQHKLYPPGRILYMTEADEGFETWWSPPEYFDHVIISAHMLTDHLPDVSYRALRSVVSQTS